MVVLLQPQQVVLVLEDLEGFLLLLHVFLHLSLPLVQLVPDVEEVLEVACERVHVGELQDTELGSPDDKREPKINAKFKINLRVRSHRLCCCN